MTRVAQRVLIFSFGEREITGDGDRAGALVKRDNRQFLHEQVE